MLIGRRHLRSNNSWMHNVPALVGGTNRCTLHIHPDDAAAWVSATARWSRVAGGEVVVPGRGDRRHPARRRVAAARLGARRTRRGSVAATQPGVNVNQLNDGSLLDPLSGTAVLNGMPVDGVGGFGAQRDLRRAPKRQPSSQTTVTEKLTVCWPGSIGTARGWPSARAASAPASAEWRRGASEIEMTLPSLSPDRSAYCCARSLASSKARAGRP